MNRASAHTRLWRTTERMKHTKHKASSPMRWIHEDYHFQINKQNPWHYVRICLLRIFNGMRIDWLHDNCNVFGNRARKRKFNGHKTPCHYIRMEQATMAVEKKTPTLSISTKWLFVSLLKGLALVRRSSVSVRSTRDFPLKTSSHFGYA